MENRITVRQQKQGGKQIPQSGPGEGIADTLQQALCNGFPRGNFPHAVLPHLIAGGHGTDGKR